MSTSVSEFVYYLAFILYTTYEVLSGTNISGVLFLSKGSLCGLLLRMVNLLLVIRLLTIRFRSHALAKTAALCMVALLIRRTSGEDKIPAALLFIAAYGDIEFGKLAKLALVVNVALFVAIVACAARGLIPIAYMADDAARGLRSSMGFVHPNRFARYLFTICLGFVVLRHGKRPFLSVAAALLSAYLSIRVSGTRTVAIMSLLMLGLVLLFHLLKRRQRLCIVLSGALVAAMAILSTYLMVNYNPANPLHYMLNDLLAARLKLMHDAYLLHPFSLFGSTYADAPIVGYSVMTHEPLHFVVDNAYGYMYLLCGMIGFLFFVLLVLATYVRAFQEEAYLPELFGLTVMLLVGFSENYALSFQSNYYMIALSTYSAALVRGYLSTMPSAAINPNVR